MKVIKAILVLVVLILAICAVGHIGNDELASRSDVVQSVTAVVDCQLTGGLTYVQTPDNHVWAYYDNDDLARGDRVQITICNGEIIDAEVLR